METECGTGGNPFDDVNDVGETNAGNPFDDVVGQNEADNPFDSTPKRPSLRRTRSRSLHDVRNTWNPTTFSPATPIRTRSRTSSFATHRESCRDPLTPLPRPTVPISSSSSEPNIPSTISDSATNMKSEERSSDDTSSEEKRKRQGSLAVTLAKHLISPRFRKKKKNKKSKPLKPIKRRRHTVATAKPNGAVDVSESSSPSSDDGTEETEETEKTEKIEKPSDSDSELSGSSVSSVGSWVHSSSPRGNIGLRPTSPTPVRRATVGPGSRLQKKHPPLGGTELRPTTVPARRFSTVETTKTTQPTGPIVPLGHQRSTSTPNEPSEWKRAPILQPTVHKTLERAHWAGKNAVSAAQNADVATNRLRHAGEELQKSTRDLTRAFGQEAVFASVSQVAELQRHVPIGHGARIRSLLHRARGDGNDTASEPGDTRPSRALETEPWDQDENNINNVNNNPTNSPSCTAVGPQRSASTSSIVRAGPNTRIRIEYPPFQPHARPNVTVELDGETNARHPNALWEKGQNAADTALLHAASQPLITSAVRSRLQQGREALVTDDMARDDAIDPKSASVSISQSSSSSSSLEEEEEEEKEENGAQSRSRSGSSLSPRALREADMDFASFLIDSASGMSSSSSEEDETPERRDTAMGPVLSRHELRKILRAERQRQRVDLVTTVHLLDQRAQRRADAQTQRLREISGQYHDMARGVQRAFRSTRQHTKNSHRKTRTLIRHTGKSHARALAEERRATTRALGNVMATLELLITPLEQQLVSIDLFRRASEDLHAVVAAQHEQSARRFERLTEEHEGIRRRDGARIRDLERTCTELENQCASLRRANERDDLLLRQMYQSGRLLSNGTASVHMLPLGAPTLAGSASSSSSDERPLSSGRLSNGMSRMPANRLRPRRNSKRPPLQKRPSQRF